MFNFEKLDVWHRAVEFADLLYQVTRTFPADEDHGQIYAAAEEQSRMLSGPRKSLLAD